MRRVRSQQKRKHNEFYAKRLEKNRNAAPSARRWLRLAPRVKHEFYANRFEKNPNAAPAAYRQKEQQIKIIDELSNDTYTKPASQVSRR